MGKKLMSANLDMDALLSEAREETKLEDFGNDSFLEGLNVLINSCNQEAQLNNIGLRFAHGMISRCLKNRLQVQDWITRHPEILDEKIEKPLIITGFPRTGSTFLQLLLSIDPANRGLHHWEASTPCPPPELIYSVADPRIKDDHDGIQMLELLKPGIQAIQQMDAGGFAECIVLLSNEFKSVYFTTSFSAPSYDEWYYSCDMNSAYAYHKMLLQLLQWRLPNEGWVLKCPAHLPWLDMIMDQYPDAQIIFTHRDPFKVVASTTSLVSAFYSLTSGQVNDKENALYFTRILAFEMDKAMKLRERLHPKSFYDLQFLDLIADPIEAVKGIYKYFGREVSPGHEKRMQVWIRDNPPDKRGIHRYSPEEFDLDPLEVRKRYAEYIERFEVQIES
jgi:hypothetical protein